MKNGNKISGFLYQDMLHEIRMFCTLVHGDSAVIAVLTHGKKDGVIYGKPPY